MSNQWKAIAGVFLVFLLGWVAGALCSSVFFSHRATTFFQRGAPAYVEVLERRFTRGMDLEPDQRTKIHAVFMANLEGRKQLQKQIQPQIQSLNHETLQQIKTILRPDQLELFRKNVSEFRRKFGRVHPNAPGLDTNSPDAPANDSTNAAPQ